MLFFTEDKIARLLEDIKATIYRETYPIPAFKFAEGEFANAHQPDFDDTDWRDFKVMDYWGGYDVTAWFRATVPIPAHLHEQRLVLRFLVGPRDGGNSTAETMLYVEGKPLQAIDVWHEEAWLPPEYTHQKEIHIALKAWSGVLGVPDRRRFKVAALHWVDETAEQVYFIADTLLQAVRQLPETDWRRHNILPGLNRALNQIRFIKPRSEEYYDSLKIALADLQAHLAWLRGQETHKPTITAIGHSHIDMAWLWRLHHTRQKAGRTFATVLHLMRQYPEYRFIHSSPQLYEYLEQDFPEIFEQVKAKIASGEWEITGGMWIEADVNVPSGESLIRQFLFGKRYIREKFGKETKLLWLPDVFGYSGSLPQIMKGCGIEYFMTTKISWSQFNRFPYDTFYWCGIDGTEILTHFITTPDTEGSWFYTYNGLLRPQDVKGIWEAYRQKAVNNDLLLTFGWGDGGGGPTREMLENARVMQDVPGFPQVRTGTAEPYFEQLADRVKDQDLPVWDGELYLEYHRGTYTSQAASKRANREMEVLYHNAEWLSALADILLNENQYPAEALNEGWKLILLNQFHDILPGSSIPQVYQDSMADYARAREIGEQAVKTAMQQITSKIKVDEPSVVVFNPVGWFRLGMIEIEGINKTLQLPNGLAAPAQVIGNSTLVLVHLIPPYGYQAYPLIDIQPQEVEIIVTTTLLENTRYKIELNTAGQITSIYDKSAGREILAGTGNQLIAFEDKPMRFDAWDIDPYYQEKPYLLTDLVEAMVEETGPLRGTLRLVWRFYDSAITQRISIYNHSSQIDFRTHIDWHEHQVLLKVAFPVNIRSTCATYDIQFGTIERPTHWNTSWDYARFEVVGHKWADLSEGNYGVALLNDCKYGYDIKDNVMRLTLIKSGITPDPNADNGEHTFTYSLLPHQGDWREANVPRMADQLNISLLSKSISPQKGIFPASIKLTMVDTENVILETLKRAEDGNGWIVRLYENQGSREKNLWLGFGRRIQKAMLCNLVEEDSIEYNVDGNTLKFDIAPYEIKTFRVIFA